MKQNVFSPAELRIIFSENEDVITTSEEYIPKENETPLMA